MESTISPTVDRQESQVAIPLEQATRRGLRLAHLWAIVPLALAWFAASIDYIEPFDFWWNVKSGQIMAQTGRFLADDVLVWTPVRLPYYNPQWGSQLLFYWLYDLSPYLLLTARGVIVTATVGIILWLCFWRAQSLKAAVLATIICYLTAWTNYGIRPQMFALLPFVAFLFLLERKDERPRWLPMLVPVMLFWVNVHGSFFLGIALLALYAAGTALERIGSGEGRRWLTSRAAGWQAFWLAASGLTSLLNPYFLDIYNYFFVATNDPVARSVNSEWQAPTLYDGTGQLFFANVFIFLISLYISKRRMRPTEILLVLAFGYLALVSLRNVMWWGWVTAPMLAANLGVWAANRRATNDQGLMRTTDPEVGEEQAISRTELPVLNWLFAVVIVGGALAVTPLWRQANPLVPEPAKAALAQGTPIKLAEFLKKGEVPAPLFNYMEWGGYLEWELYPQYKMFIDGRFEARQVQIWEDYLDISRGHADWQQILDRYKIRTLVLNKEFHKGLIPQVEQSQKWRKVYEDKTALVYTR